MPCVEVYARLLLRGNVNRGMGIVMMILELAMPSSEYWLLGVMQMGMWLASFRGLAPKACVEVSARSWSKCCITLASARLLRRCCVTRGVGIVIMVLELVMRGWEFSFRVAMQMGLWLASFRGFATTACVEASSRLL